VYETDWSSATNWLETAPDGSLEEIWEKVSDGDGKFLAARRGTSILVIAGKYFAYAEDDGVERSVYHYGLIKCN